MSSSRCTCTRLSKLPLSTGSSAAAAASRQQSLSQSLSLTSSRAFTTTTAFQKVPPAAPGWIQVPTPPQSESSEHKPPPVKGTLPPPRTVFHGGEKDHKLRPGHLERTAPRATNADSLRPAQPGSPLDIRRRMAESRRENLTEGLEGLYKRKRARDARQKHHNETRAAASRARLDAPERADDVLTRPTVLRATLEQTAVKPDPLRFERTEASRRRTAELAQRRAEARRDAVTALYMNAADFIVDENHLANEIDRLFSEDYFKKQARSHSTDAANAWDVWGVPPTMGNLSASHLRTGGISEWDSSDAERSVKRQKDIAEELTGGKMD